MTTEQQPEPVACESNCIFRRHPLIAILAVAFVLRLAWLVYIQPKPVDDYLIVKRGAESLVDHFQYGYPERGSYWLPGNSAFLAVVMLVSRVDFWLSLVNVAMSTAICGLVFVLARRLFGRDKEALLAALICALNPTFVFYSPVLASEHVFVPLLILCMLLALARRGPRWLHAIVCGVLLGAATLTRGEAIFHSPVLFAAFLLPPVSAGVPWRKRIVSAVLLTADRQPYIFLPIESAFVVRFAPVSPSLTGRAICLCRMVRLGFARRLSASGSVPSVRQRHPQLLRRGDMGRSAGIEPRGVPRVRGDAGDGVARDPRQHGAA